MTPPPPLADRTFRRPCGWSLHHRLVLLFLLVFIPVLLAIAAGAFVIAQRDIQNARATVATYVRILGEEYERVVDGTALTLDVLSQSVSRQAVQGPACDRLMATMTDEQPLYTVLWKVALDGTVLCSSTPMTGPINARRGPAFDNALRATDTPQVTPFLIGEQSNRPVLVITKRYFAPSDRPMGDYLLSVGVDLAWFSARADLVSASPGWSLKVIGADGSILARYPLDPAPAQVQWPIEHLPRGTAVPTSKVELPDEPDRLYAIRSLSGGQEGPFLAIGVPTQDAYATARDVALMLLAVLVGSIALTVGLAAVGIRRFVHRDVGPFTAAAQALADPETTAPPAFGAVPREMAPLADAIERSWLQIQLWRAHVTQAQTAAEAANRARGAFLGRVSHELRTPLNAIIGMSEALSLRELGLSEARRLEYARDIHFAGTHLLSIIDQILDQSRLEHLRKTEEREAIDLGDQVHAVLRILNEVAIVHGVHPEALVQPGARLVHASAQDVRQILINLLSNAIKYAGRGARVTVSTDRTDDGMIAMRVSDSGSGMTEEQVARLFEPFRPGESAEVTREGGIGLGLSITRMLVEQNGGQIRIDSAPGHGTTATVRLPTAEATSAAA